MLKRFLTSFFLILTMGSTASAAVIIVDPSATYLRTSEYVGFLPNSAIAYSLSDLGFVGGQTVLMQRLGSYQAKNGGNDTSKGISAIFSSSSELLGPLNSSTMPGTLVTTPLNRVVDALVSGQPEFVSKPSYHGLLPSDPKTTLATDIPEDFNITTAGVIVEIPWEAKYMFFSAFDNMFGDNSDPNKDFGVSITAVTTAVPEPTSLGLIALGMSALAGFSRRRKV